MTWPASPHTTRVLTWALGVVTAGLLVATVGLAVGQWRTSPVAWTGATTTAGPGPVLRRDGAVVPLPGSFVALEPSERLFYADRRGRPLASVRWAAVLVPGACEEHEGSNRGFVGFAGSAGLPPGEAHAVQVRRWTAALRAAVGGSPRAAPVGVAPRLRTDLVVAVAEEVRHGLPCQPPEVRASVLTVPDRGGGSVTVVLVRDAGVEDALGDGAAELVLRAVRVSGGGS